MIRQVRRALREDHVQTRWSFNQPQQHGRRSRRVIQEIQEVLGYRAVSLGQQLRQGIGRVRGTRELFLDQSAQRPVSL
jgi:hypothetical protein